jgi:2-aminoethylphosphonate-pyruvate transaminase
LSQRTVLLNPGPVNVSSKVQQALLRGDLCHREPEFAKLMTNVRRLLEGLFAPSGSHAAVLVTGSGTSAVEAAVAGLCPAGKKLAVVTNGVYGERIAEIAKRHEIAVHAIAPSAEGTAFGAPRTWMTIPTTAQVLAALDDPNVAGLAAVHHETTTGLLNPIKEWGQLAKARGKFFLVDTVSGIAGEDLELEAWGIDVACGTANKCLQGLPGISFVLARKQALEAMRAVPARTLYLDLPKAWDAQEKGAPAFTMAVQVLFAFEAALEELKEETVAGRIGRMRRVSRLIRKGLAELGLSFCLPEPVRSNTITTVGLPFGITYPALHDALKEKGFVIYAGQGGLEKHVFRVANMGAIADAEFEAFLAALRAVVAQSKAGAKTGARA